MYTSNIHDIISCVYILSTQIISDQTRDYNEGQADVFVKSEISRTLTINEKFHGFAFATIISCITYQLVALLYCIQYLVAKSGT